MTAATRMPESRRSAFLDVLAPRIHEPFALFAFLMAFGVLNHTHTLGALATNYSITHPAKIAETVLELAAIALLFRPSSRRLFMVMSGGIAIAVLLKMPSLVNHWLAFGVMTSAYVALGVATLRQPDTEDRRSSIAAGSMYLGAVAIISVWIFAAFHKLNSGFFDAVHSCAVDHGNDLTDLIGLGRPIDGGPVGAFLIIAAIGTEIAVPILLLVRRQRLLGLALAFAFHTVMAINGHQAFSGLALALYVPFLPAGVWSGFDRDDLWERVAFRYIQIAGMALALGGAVTFLLSSEYKLTQAGEIVPALFYLPGSMLIAAVVYRAVKRSGASGADRSTASSMLSGLDERMRRSITVISVVMVAAFAVNGVMPYLGLKTQLTISMFSNLRVETEERWNHLLVPQAVNVFGSDDDIIQVTSVDSEDLEWLEGRLMHRLEVRRRVSEECGREPIPMTYEVDGAATITELADACDSEFGATPSILQRKVLRFREVLDPNSCQW